MNRGTAEHRWWKEQQQVQSMVAAVLRGDRVMMVSATTEDAARMLARVKEALGPIETDLISAGVIP